MLITGMYDFCPTDFPLHVVLVEPQIPPNTGNIARTCAATRTPLHLVGPLGFALSDRYLKRAGLDYWPHVIWRTYPDWQTFVSTGTQGASRWLAFTPQGESCLWEVRFQPGDWLFFGSETEGLPDVCLQACPIHVRIPMVEPGVRSLNLSVSVAVGLFEARRQLAY
ncbi:MAG: tRNA (cytidine(34)-2'-O)-methyltransferase [Gloeomargarita sp. HHBFW_bins_162]